MPWQTNVAVIICHCVYSTWVKTDWKTIAWLKNGSSLKSFCYLWTTRYFWPPSQCFGKYAVGKYLINFGSKTWWIVGSNLTQPCLKWVESEFSLQKNRVRLQNSRLRKVIFQNSVRQLKNYLDQSWVSNELLFELRHILVFYFHMNQSWVFIFQTFSKASDKISLECRWP